ncbi:MAG TPA: PAS domain S-box protein, partial [Bacteroidaceae bacterium]|nr:PAS domain S-box protein [Bacteroidaceae bacterium]
MENATLEQKEFIENFSDGIIIHDNGKILWVNSAAATLIGKTQENLKDGNFLELFSPDQRKILQKKYIQEIKQKKSIPVYEFDLITSDSHILPVEINAILFKYGDNPAVFCMIRDISERKKTENALRQSENLYRTLVETLQDGLSITDLQGKILYCNQKKAKMFGYDSPDKIIGTNCFDLLAPEERGRAVEMMQQIIRQSILKNLEFTVIRKDGSRFPAELRASTLYDETGKPVQIVDIIRDITDQKKVEQAIRESEKRYREFIENSPNPIFTINKKGIIQIWNAACESIFQYKKNQIVGKAHHELLWYPKNLKSIQSKIKQVWTGKTLNNEDLTFLCKDGSFRHTVSRLYPLHDQENRIHGCVFANTDITKRRKMEEDLLTEHSFRSGIIKNAAEGLCVCHEIKDFPYIKFSVWNDRMTEITGYT